MNQLILFGMYIFLMFNFLPLCFRYKGTWDAFRSIVQQDGIRGLWKGWAPNCQRAAFVCLEGKYGERQ